MIRDDVARAGVNVGHLLFTCEQRTAMWVGILDARGDMDVGVFGGEILAALTPEFIRERAEVIADADLIAVDGTVPRETMSTIVEIARVHARPLYLNPASVGYAHGVADRIRDFALVTGNALEVQVLTGQRIRGVEDAERAAQILIERGVERAIVTLGAEGIVYADACVSRHEPAEPTDVVDTTGAGDALAAMFILCHLQARSLDETLTRCLHAAAVTAACGESVSQRIGSGWGRGWRLEVGD
jgi:pseudouridine kinase